MQRETFVEGTASPGRGGAALSDERSRSHLAAGHAVDCVVDEEDGDLLAAIRGVHDFGGGDGGKVTVALIGNDDFVGAGAFEPGGRGGSASVGDLHVANIEVVVGKHRTPDRADENGLILQFQVFNGLRDQLVNNPVAASGTVVRLMLEVGL